MATTAGEVLGGGSPQADGSKPNIVQFIDRWIYVIVAAWFIAVALVGFVPSSIGKVMAVQAGIRPPFPLVLHAHAVLMGSWLVLLLIQSTLMATGRRALHWQLGMASLILAPAIVIAATLLIVTSYYGVWFALQAAPAGPASAPLEQTFVFMGNLMLALIRTAIVFSTLTIWALVVRRRDPGTHKRLMFLATTVFLPAAFDRMPFLPNSMPESTWGTELYAIACFAPLLLWDVYRQRRVHRAYVIWFAISLPLALAQFLLWGTRWWGESMQRVFGLS